MVYEFDNEELLGRFNSQPLTKLIHCVEKVILEDGRLAEIQIVVTTYEKDMVKTIGMKGEV